MKPQWSLIIASGPSLTRADCDALRGVCSMTIAVNNSVDFAPWADILYAGDAKWWRIEGAKRHWFKGERVSHQEYQGTRRWEGSGRFARFGGNSGHQAVQYAVSRGAKALALLGFDHKYQVFGKDEHGRKLYKRHFHGDHPKELGNAQTIDHWPRIMARTAEDLRRMQIPVLNLSRETALTCFERMSVEDFVRQVA